MNYHPTFHIGNYRRLAPGQSVPVAPITIIVGNNSSGKSAVIDAISDTLSMYRRSTTKIYEEDRDSSSNHSFVSTVRSSDVARGMQLGHVSPDGYGITFTLAMLDRGFVAPKEVTVYAGGLEILRFTHVHLDDAGDYQNVWHFDPDDEFASDEVWVSNPRDLAACNANVSNIEAWIDGWTREGQGASDPHVWQALRAFAGSSVPIDWRGFVDSLRSENRPKVGIDLSPTTPINVFRPSFVQVVQGYDNETSVIPCGHDPVRFLWPGEVEQTIDPVSDPSFVIPYIYRACASAIQDYTSVMRLPEVRLRTSRYIDPSYPYGHDWKLRGGPYYKSMRQAIDVREKVNGWLKSAGGTFRSYEYHVIDLVERRHRTHDNATNDLLKQINVETTPETSAAEYSEQRLALWDDSSGLYVGLDEVGTGISQVTPVLAMLYGEANSILQIEQPELHLHPRLAARLADAMIDSTARGNRVVVETHSEHLILRLLHFVRNQTPIHALGRPLTPDDIQIIFVEGDGSQSRVIPIDVLPSGNLSRPWPNGFFDEDYEGGV